jgi:hypothetical protein
MQGQKKCWYNLFIVIHLNSRPIVSVMFEYARIQNLKHKNNAVGDFDVCEVWNLVEGHWIMLKFYIKLTGQDAKFLIMCMLPASD